MTTLRQFANQHRITMTVRELGLQTDDDGWQHYAYRVTLRTRDQGTGQQRAMTVPYRMGTAHTVGPQVDEVLDSLSLDAQSYEDAGSFEDFALELGYDSDSRTAERVYKACGKVRDQLERLLGREGLDALYGAERL